jgi:hypothetical protein
MTVIQLKRGQTLSVLVTWLDGDDDPIVIDGTYTMAAAFRETGSEDERTAITAELYEGGKTWVHHDTVSMSPGTYVFDVQLVTPEGFECPTETLKLTITEPVTEPQPRPEP